MLIHKINDNYIALTVEYVTTVFIAQAKYKYLVLTPE